MAIERSVSSAYEKSRVITTSAGDSLSIEAYNKNSADLLYLLMFDAESLPANGEVPDWPPIPIPNETYVVMDTPRTFTTGMVLALSSTSATLTLAAASDGFFAVRYKE